MFQVAIMTLALTTGDCPACAARQYHPIIYALPHAIVGCAGQYCLSCNRPLSPGLPVYDYRTDFDYPWNQKPYAPWAYYPVGPLPRIAPDRRQPEELPLPRAEEASTKHRPKSSVVTARHGKVRVVEGPQRALFAR